MKKPFIALAFLAVAAVAYAGIPTGAAIDTTIHWFRNGLYVGGPQTTATTANKVTGIYTRTASPYISPIDGGTTYSLNYGLPGGGGLIGDLCVVSADPDREDVLGSRVPGRFKCVVSDAGAVTLSVYNSDTTRQLDAGTVNLTMTVFSHQ